jgi:GNAT superfamily N-acetyltransferase
MGADRSSEHLANPAGRVRRREEATVMRHHALACDYDGTIAHDGRVDQDTAAGLERLPTLAAGCCWSPAANSTTCSRPSLQVELFDRVVAENGALLYRLTDESATPLGERPPERTYDQARAEWEQGFDDEDFTTFVAERDGRVVGSAVGCSLSVSTMHRGLARPDPAAFFAFAAVRPQARGTGAGRALGEAVIDWAAKAGYDRIVADWRSTNLLASRAWPRLGYAETFLRLHRLIGY